jgi:hypothetical protein
MPSEMVKTGYLLFTFLQDARDHQNCSVSGQCEGGSDLISIASLHIYPACPGSLHQLPLETKSLKILLVLVGEKVSFLVTF